MSEPAAPHWVMPGKAKFAAPGVPRGSFERARMHRLLGELVDTYSIVEIVAAAGAGKTVDAQLYAAATDRRLAWLTLDQSDRSAAGLVFDLATALGPMAADAVDAMRQTLQASGTAQEAAAILATSIEQAEILLVIDECQQIALATDAASALDTFLEYLPEHVRVLLLAREELPWPLQKRYVHGQIAKLDDAAVSLSADEVSEYVARQNGSPETAERIFDLTGGWMAGVVFASRYGVGEELNLRDLSVYLDTQVLQTLPEDEQWFLLRTSVTDAITRGVAEALCGPDGARLWSTVSGRHLPATSTTPTAIVTHSLFRTFLHQRLLETDPRCERDMRTAYARHLEHMHQFAESTDVWLSVADHEAAMRTAKLALPGVFQDADWPALVRWCAVLGEDRVLADPVLTGAHIRAVYGGRDFDRARALVRRLDREGRLRPAIDADPGLLATVGWALQAQPQEALAMLDKYDGDARADVVRYMLEAWVATRPVTGPPCDDMPDVERLMTWGLFIQGRLGELARMEPPDADAPLLNPNIALASAFRGEAARAHELWLRVPNEIRDRPQSHFILGMIELFTGTRENARAELRQALTDSHRTGFSIGPVYEVFLAYVELLSDDPMDAVTRLEALLETLSRAGHTAMVELTQCFLGIGHLLVGRTVEARLMLRDSVVSMTRGQRRLMLSVSAVALAEAEARLGDLEAAHRAAEAAFHSAQLIGSFAPLVHAVRIFPEVQRREAARRPDDSRWRRLVVAPSARPVVTVSPRPDAARHLRLLPFGRGRDLVLDGQPLGIGRTKILELVACLALHPEGLNRFELQQCLFPEADQRSGGNHFRQIAHKLRHATDIVLDRNGPLVQFSRNVTVVANDITSERLLSEASSFEGKERRQRLLEGLGLVTGVYLDGSQLPWVEDRRNYLELVHEEARLELATLHLEMGEPDAARTVCEEVLAFNRYSDPAYRVLVEIERQVGSESSALAVFRRAAGAMGELGLSPGIARTIMRGAQLRPVR